MKKHKGWKIAGIIVGSLLIVVLGFSLWISANYERILQEKAPKWLAKGTDSTYKMSIEDISINIFTRNATFKGVKIWADSQYIQSMNPTDAPSTLLNVSIPELNIENIQWADIIADKDIICGRLVIRNSKIEVLSTPQPPDSLKEQTKTAKDKKEPKINRIQSGEIIVLNPELSYRNKDSANTVHYLAGGGKLVLHDWEFNAGEPKEPGRFFYAKRAEIALDSFTQYSDDGLYKVQSGRIEFSSGRKSLTVKAFKLKTDLSKEEFYKKKGHQTDLFDIEFPGIDIQGLEWQQLIDRGRLIVSSIDLNEGRFDDYFTRLAPPNPESKMGKFPNQLLLKLPIDIYVPEINISSGSMSYTEVNEKSKRAGKLSFTNVNGSIRNATNMPAYIEKEGNCTLDLKAGFNGKSPIHAVFQLSLKDSSGGFIVDGTLKDLDAAQVNDAAKALALASIDGLHISKLDMHIEGNERHASGNVTLLYQGLEVSLLDTTRDWHKIALEEKGTLSFLANSLILYPNNPMDGDNVRSETAYTERDEHKSFFNLIWKTIFSGVQKTAIRSDAVEKAIEAGQKNKGKKKGFFKRLFSKKEEG